MLYIYHLIRSDAYCASHTHSMHRCARANDASFARSLNCAYHMDRHAGAGSSHIALRHEGEREGGKKRKREKVSLQKACFSRKEELPVYVLAAEKRDT